MSAQTTTSNFSPTPFAPGLSWSEQDALAALQERLNAPVKDTDRAAAVLAGAEREPTFAVTSMGDAQGFTFGQMTGKLRCVMAVALYLSNCTAADLRRTKDPKVLESLAAPVLQRHGFEYLEDLDFRGRAAAGRGDGNEHDRIFPQARRFVEAADAAYRWAEKRLPRSA